MTTAEKTMQAEQAKFDHLCHLYIYHFIDVHHRHTHAPQFRTAVAVLKRDGLIAGDYDHQQVEFHYDRILAVYARRMLPDTFKPTFDYWGAKCFATRNGCKHHTFAAGATSGKYMAFASWDAMVEYFARRVEEIVDV